MVGARRTLHLRLITEHGYDTFAGRTTLPPHTTVGNAGRKNFARHLPPAARRGEKIWLPPLPHTAPPGLPTPCLLLAGTACPLPAPLPLYAYNTKHYRLNSPPVLPFPGLFYWLLLHLTLVVYSARLGLNTRTRCWRGMVATGHLQPAVSVNVRCVPCDWTWTTIYALCAALPPLTLFLTFVPSGRAHGGDVPPGGACVLLTSTIHAHVWLAGCARRDMVRHRPHYQRISPPIHPFIPSVTVIMPARPPGSATHCTQHGDCPLFFTIRFMRLDAFCRAPGRGIPLPGWCTLPSNGYAWWDGTFGRAYRSWMAFAVRHCRATTPPRLQQPGHLRTTLLQWCRTYLTATLRYRHHAPTLWGV